MAKETKNKALAITALTLSVLTALGLAGGFTAKAIHDYRESHKEEQEEEQNGGMELEDPADVEAAADGSKRVSMTSVKIPRKQYAEYGVSPAAETALQVTATVTPANAEDAKIDWSVAWKSGADGQWGNGKTVTDYVTVTPTSDGALTANVECSQAFGEVIVLTAAIRGNEEIHATKNVQYVQGYSGFSVKVVYTNSSTPAANVTWNIDSSNSGNVQLSFPGYAKTYQEFVNYYSATGSNKGTYSVTATTNLTDTYTKAATVTDTKLDFIYQQRYISTLIKGKVEGIKTMEAMGTSTAAGYTGNGATCSISGFDFEKLFFPKEITATSGEKTLGYTNFDMAPFKQELYRLSNLGSSGSIIFALKYTSTVNGVEQAKQKNLIFDASTIGTLASSVTMAGGDLEFGG